MNSLIAMRSIRSTPSAWLITAISTVVAGVLLTSPQQAHADRVDLSIGSSVRWAHTNSADALSADDSFPFFSLNAGVRVDKPLLPGFQLVLDGTIERGGMSGTSFGRLRSDVSLWSFQVGARARRNIARRVTAFGRAALGLQRAVVSLSDHFDGQAMKDKGWAATTYLGLGAEVTVFRKTKRNAGPASLGFRFEVGYLAATSFQVDAIPDDDDDNTIRIPTMTSSLGDLNLSSLTMRIAFVGSF